MAGPVRALFVATHPSQYAAPQFRRLAADPRIEATVAYLSMQGAEPGLDEGFGLEVRWDIPLLDGYDWVLLRNGAPRPSIDRSLGRVDPAVWRTVRRGAFDVVVCYGYRAVSFWIAAAAAKTRGTALVWATDATTLASRGGPRWKRHVKAALLPVIYRMADGVLTPSSRSAGFVRSLGVPAQRVFMAPFAVDNDFFSERAAHVDREAVRRAWSVPTNAVVAAFVGKLVPWKRPADLLEAAAMVPDLWVALAGEGEDRSALEHRAKELGVDDRVRFLGFRNQTELPAVYAASDVLVVPSAFEPFGLVVNEAFACGVPALVSDACGSAGDLVLDGTTGFTFRPGDVETVASLLQLLVRDAGLRSRLAAGARTRIAAWDLTAWCDVTIEALTRLA